jgi:hypothetical protein
MIRSPLFAVVLVAACATAPAPTAPPPKASQPKGRAWGIGGLGPMDKNGKQIPVELGVDAQEDVHKRPRCMVPPHPAPRIVVPKVPPGEDLVIAKLEVARTSLDRGRRGQVLASLRAPADLSVTIEAKADVPGYDFTVPVGRERGAGGQRGGALFYVRCKNEGPAHRVTWTFVLRDDATGRKGNTAEVALECTGRNPPPPPQLEIELDSSPLTAGESRMGVARITGSNPPFALAAQGEAPVIGYEWFLPVERAPTQTTFAIGCRKGKPPHTVLWHFEVWDVDGMISNGFDRAVECRAAPSP